MESRSAGHELNSNPADSMIRFLVLFALVVLVAVAAAPRLIPVLTWVLAFLSLLMLGDLVLSAMPKGRAGRR